VTAIGAFAASESLILLVRKGGESEEKPMRFHMASANIEDFETVARLIATDRMAPSVPEHL
jgi:hypothetical protein